MLGTNLGDISDIDLENYKNNKDSFAGNYGKIIQKLKVIQPEAKFFILTLPKSGIDDTFNKAADIHQKLLYDMAKLFSNTYVLDFREYGPIQDEDYKRNFYMSGHLNPMGYVLTAKMVISYIDYIIRHNMEAFKKVAFIGTEFEQLEERTINDDNEALIFASYHEIIK